MPDRVDNARNIDPEDQRKRAGGLGALALLVVSWVESGRVDANTHLAGLWLWQWHLGQVEML